MSTTGTPKTAAEIQQDWDTNPRWKGVTRNFTAEQVVKLQGAIRRWLVPYLLARSYCWPADAVRAGLPLFLGISWFRNRRSSR